MPPTIHCIRHGQGFHNVGAGFYTLPDPSLTPLGQSQCHTLQHTSFPPDRQSSLSLITSSSLSRALQTASIVFHSALTTPGAKCPPNILALPDAQETSDDACDIGSDPSVLRKAAKDNDWPVDLSLVVDGWNVKKLGGRYSPHSDAIAARARDTRLFLRQKIRELVAGGDVDAEVVLVSHGGFLHYFADDWEHAGDFPGTGWRNCEVRSYVFEKGVMEEEGVDGDAEARVTETTESRRGRGKIGPMVGREGQPELFEIAMRRWGEQGLQRPDRLGENEADAGTGTGTGTGTEQVVGLVGASGAEVIKVAA